MKPSDVAGKLAHGGCSADVSTPFGLTGSLILLVAPQRDSPGQSGHVRIRAKPHRPRRFSWVFVCQGRIASAPDCGSEAHRSSAADPGVPSASV